MDDQDPLANVHIERNRVTREDWDDFASHRARVTELILAATDAEHSTLCVLGAGNGNDFDLARLAERFAKITLVDLDPEALDHCLARQSDSIKARVETIGGVDLSGIRESLGERQVLQLAHYNVVVSTCLLTQMIDSLGHVMGTTHADYARRSLELRDEHLKLLCDLTRPAGTALLVTDFVSSDTLPQLADIPESELESALAQAINDRNFFMGVNPGVLERQFKSISGSSVVELHHPWRWKLGNRTYAVCAVSMRKRMAQRPMV